MDITVEPQDARGVLPIPRCRQLLAEEAIDLADSEVEEIRRHAHALAHTLLNVYLQHPDRKGASGCRQPDTP